VLPSCVSAVLCYPALADHAELLALGPALSAAGPRPLATAAVRVPLQRAAQPQHNTAQHNMVIARHCDGGGLRHHGVQCEAEKEGERRK
jgi:hypothetical protein